MAREGKMPHHGTAGRVAGTAPTMPTAGTAAVPSVMSNLSRPRYVVAISGSVGYGSDFLRGLGPFVSLDIGDVYIHNAPVEAMLGSKALMNYDVVIHSEDMHGSGYPFTPEHRIIRRSRYSKKDQQGILHKALLVFQQKYGTTPKHFKLVPTYSDISDRTHYESQFIIRKSDYGARSLGQLIINTHVIDPVWFLAHYNEKISQCKTTEEVLDLIPVGVSYIAGFECYPNEGIEQLKSDTFSWASLITGVTAEFRVVTSPDKNYIQRRQRMSADVYVGREQYHIATGAQDGCPTEDIRYHESTFFAQFGPSGDSESDIAFYRFLSKEFFSIGTSCDVFFCGETAQWGIFEFSSEYGTSGWSVEACKEFHRGLLTGVITRYVEGESKIAGSNIGGRLCDQLG